ncbi:putative disease resistance protein RGA3 [Phragmites australis]|uniref:putative disease resistance protein RGA3 n=1 Tax=Phragmites australis TaxID=29695 RepID=UPI002D784BC3|nr:putative disease resistance protein RGA3 [Phragmites australis]
MATGLVSSLLSSLTKLLDLLPSPPAVSWPPRSSGGRSTVSNDLQRLERLLRRVQATLDDAGERELRDSSVKLWIEELTDLARDAEDVLDDHRYELLRRRVQERQGAAFAASASTSRKRKHEDDEEEEDGGISERIGEITRRFEEISRDRSALQLGPGDGERIAGRDFQWESRTTSHLLDESLVFGRSNEKESIIELVLSCSHGTGTQVLPVVGMGGIGKTTVAQMVYNDSRVKERFDLRGWVHVSQTFDLRRLTTAIAESLTWKQCGYNELSSVHHVLEEETDKKSVFLVLDDVWNERESCWQDLLCPLKLAKTVTILVTTRSKEVARLVQTVDPFALGSLPKDYCWLLF